MSNHMCEYETEGSHCYLPGALSELAGGGPYYCAFHFDALKGRANHSKMGLVQWLDDNREFRLKYPKKHWDIYTNDALWRAVSGEATLPELDSSQPPTPVLTKVAMSRYMEVIQQMLDGEAGGADAAIAKLHQEVGCPPYCGKHTMQTALEQDDNDTRTRESKSA